MKQTSFLWLRVFFFCIFLIGSAVLIFWAQGFRYDFHTGKFIPTGVLRIATPLQMGLFLDDEYIGTSNDTLLDIPLGKHRLCIKSAERHAICETVEIEQKTVFSYHDILLAKKAKPIRIAPEEEVVFDPLGRGILRLYPGLKATLVWEDEDKRVRDEFDLEQWNLNKEGDLLLEEGETTPIFEAKAYGRPVESGGRLLYVSGEHILSIYHNEDPVTKLSFLDPVEEAFFLSDSDSFIVILEEKVYFFATPNTEPLLLFERDKDTPVVFLAREQRFFWHENGTVWSYSIW